MGMKRKYAKNVTRDNQFFKTYAVKMNALLRYAEDNEKVTDAIERLQNDLQYTVASADSHAKKREKNITKLYEELKAMLQQPGWNEQQVLLLVKNIGAEVDEINSMR